MIAFSDPVRLALGAMCFCTAIVTFSMWRRVRYVPAARPWIGLGLAITNAVLCAYWIGLVVT